MPQIFSIFIQTAARFSIFREPGCLIKVKQGTKTDRLVCSYLIVNNLILFKPFKTHQKFVKKC